ncbi:hypothetical protein EX30DRAFT_374051 [Ascodesmis nigricans]|uniref:Uncharacterized protein n=1 Tax=Ascodesmis nigricans TaxID=341454 RepID=A0A4S2MRZ1_9PEZI|nr:hypothetical protein EX30DRAFT_374051 [Ascodesmis nigricans]
MALRKMALFLEQFTSLVRTDTKCSAPLTARPASTKINDANSSGCLDNGHGEGNAKTKSGFEQADVSAAAAQNELLLFGTGIGTLDHCESDEVRDVLTRLTERYRLLRLDVKDSEEWTSADAWVPEAGVESRCATPEVVEEKVDRDSKAVTLDLPRFDMIYGFHDEGSQNECSSIFSDSASDIAEKRSKDEYLFLKPRPFQRSLSDIQSRVKGTSYETPPWDFVASKLHGRLYNLNRLVTNLAGAIQRPGAYCGQNSGNQVQPTSGPSASWSTTSSGSNRQQGSKRASPSDEDSDKDPEEEDRRKRRNGPIDKSDKLIRCPLSDYIPQKMNRRAKRGQPSRPAEKCDRGPFNSFEELRNHLRDDHKGCPMCLPERPEGPKSKNDSWYFRDDHYLRQHINAVHLKHCWTKCARCTGFEELPGVGLDHFQWKICKSCRKGDNRGAQAVKTQGSPEEKKAAKRKLSDWYQELQEFANLVHRTPGGLEMEKILKTPSGEWKYDYVRSIDNLPNGFNAPRTKHQSLPTPPPTVGFESSPSPPADNLSDDHFYDDITMEGGETQQSTPPPSNTVSGPTYSAQERFDLSSGHSSGVFMNAATISSQTPLVPAQQTYELGVYPNDVDLGLSTHELELPIDTGFQDPLSSEPYGSVATQTRMGTTATEAIFRRPRYVRNYETVTATALPSSSVLPDIALITQQCQANPEFRSQLLQSLARLCSDEMFNAVICYPSSSHLDQSMIQIDHPDSGLGDMEPDGVREDALDHFASQQYPGTTPSEEAFDGGEHMTNLNWFKM